VHGTTGYEFARLVNGLFVFQDNEHKLDRVYQRFVGHPIDFDTTLYECKKLVARSRLSSELTVLTNQLDAIAQSSRSTRDYTLNGLRDALTETVACFPVYRTYIARGRSSDQDRRFIEWAIAQAKKRSPAADVSIFDFVRDVMLMEKLPFDPLSGVYDQVFRFVMRFQQYSAPVMAKGMEDTAMYRYNRLLSLNDVGGDPRHFGTSIDAFHYANTQRRDNWPHAMIHTSTHDSKRGEDVHARLNVLSEIPELWGRHLGRWRRLNRAHHRETNGQRVPSSNDEYLLYQTLAAIWPDNGIDANGLALYRERIAAYMLKAVREAKVRTSWVNPNADYEQGVEHFVRTVLRAPDTAFATDLTAFARRVARFGYLNGLAQTALKLAAPGVPDIYQGNEIWAFNLVDPDNRRPVDFAHRQHLLQQFTELPEDEPSLRATLFDMLAHLEDGRAKLYLTWRLLGLRREREVLFTHGAYLALAAQGERAAHVCAFARILQEQSVLVIAPRWFAHLAGDAEEPPPDAAWNGTHVVIPAQIPEGDYRDIFTNTNVTIRRESGETIPLDRALAVFPVVVLAREPI
jgi:(1->4)-alpha-D-glucan 1-alpha-D-glucosylmutase